MKRLLKSLAGKSVDGLARVLAPTRAAPSDHASERAAELRRAVASVPALPETAPGQAENEWIAYRRMVREAIANEPAESFLRWFVIRETMFIGNSATAVAEWRELKRAPNFDRYKRALEETAVGQPTPFLLYPRTSGSQVHHTYFLWQFESLAKQDVSKAKLVFEFGGGYGSMCRQVHKLGFAGRYVIFDLPEFSHLQRYFLTSIGLEVLSPEQWLASEKGILLVSDLDELARIVPQVSEVVSPRLFIATWSLSESPADLREKIIPLIRSFDWFLITYQVRFGTVENADYFENWSKSQEPRTYWHHGPLPIMPGHFYLMGHAP
jgi:hypothetical protein